MNRTKLLIVALLSLAVASAGFAKEIVLPAFAPMTPEVKAQGGAFTAVSKGYNALFFNPAGFSSEKGSLTLLSVNPTGNVSPGSITTIIDNLPAITSGNIIGAANILNEIITKQGIGAQVNAGLGWVGGGLGLGVAAQSSVFAKGKSILGTTVVADITEGAVIGYALPINLAVSKLRIGVDIRPMQRTYGTFALSDAATVMSGSVNLSNGFALAFDAGVLADIGPFTLGASIRDLGGTTFDMSLYPVSEILSGATFPSTVGDLDDNTYTTPMTLNTGIAFTPKMGPFGLLIQPRIAADVSFPVLSALAPPSLLANTHLGAEVKVLNFIKLRAGLNQGWVTIGAGVKLLFLDANVAVYSDELGQFSGSDRKPGIAAEVALRF